MPCRFLEIWLRLELRIQKIKTHKRLLRAVEAFVFSLAATLFIPTGAYAAVVGVRMVADTFEFKPGCGLVKPLKEAVGNPINDVGGALIFIIPGLAALAFLGGLVIYRTGVGSTLLSWAGRVSLGVILLPVVVFALALYIGLKC